MEPEEMDWWDVVSGLLEEVDYWDTNFSEEITPHQASEHLLEVLRDAGRFQARLRARAEAAEAERDRLHAIVADLVAEHDFGAPANVPVSPETWRQARAALSGGGDD